ncbi:HAD-IA family hydrolase [uncultured Succinatimonas sp.]|uniref:HAD family hydrolase n=1 Tax=uncultured Succinatimonas sp. TaxID=1262973 RepID=UPI0025E3A0AE|nr:HAD-IA family hydrolase [uncultured Succinatimonas sp.]
MIDKNKIFEFKYIIFDLDGTLCDTEHLHADAWTAVAQKYGMPPITHELLIKIGGISTINLSKMFCKQYGINVDPQIIADEKAQNYFDNFLPKTQKFESICSILREAHDRGIKTAIATGSQIKETNYLIELFGLTSYVDAVVTADQIKNGKPAPDTYLEACKRLNATPAECLVFEDTPIGLQGVKAAGMTCIRVFEGKIVSDDFIKP